GLAQRLHGAGHQPRRAAGDARVRDRPAGAPPPPDAEPTHSGRDTAGNDEISEVGIHAQPTSDAVHRGDPNVVVAQGNHFVSLESKGQPEAADALEVLHLPWRSWTQLEQK